MLNTRLGQEEAAVLCGVLQDIGRLPGVDRSTRREARRWARAMRPSMPRRDVRRVAWLLYDATGQPRISSAQQDAIRSWAAYLEGLI